MLQEFLFRRQLQVDGRQVGPGNLIKPSALLWAFLETSEAQMASLNWNHPRLAKNGLSLLIIHNQLKMKRVPEFGEKLVIETAPIGRQGAQLYRGFRVLDHEEEIGFMKQTSVAVHPETHQLLRPKVFYDFEIFPDRKVPDHWLIIPPKVPERLNYLGERRIYYSDLDYNNHLSNTIYADVVLDFWPQVSGPRKFSELHIQYVSEALLGDCLRLEGQQQQDGSFFCQGWHGRGLCFKAYGKSTL